MDMRQAGVVMDDGAIGIVAGADVLRHLRVRAGWSRRP
jgi:hypothetical protein